MGGRGDEGIIPVLLFIPDDYDATVHNKKDKQSQDLSNPLNIIHSRDTQEAQETAHIRLPSSTGTATVKVNESTKVQELNTNKKVY
jgi:hypothetical protein